MTDRNEIRVEPHTSMSSSHAWKAYMPHRPGIEPFYGRTKSEAWQKMKEVVARLDEDDCTYLYFKPGGKWKYKGRGRFPRPVHRGWHDVNRTEIMRENGSMPGLVDGYDAGELVVVVIPDDNCVVTSAYPRMLKETE